MNPPIPKSGYLSDFRVKSSLGVAIAGLFFLTPFSFNNFFQGRYLLGVGSLAIVAILAGSAWSNYRGRYHPYLTFIGLVPVTVAFLVFAFQRQGVIGAFWCYPAVIAYYFMLPERQAWIANGVLLCIVIPQAWSVLKYPLALRVSVTLMAVSIFSVIFVRVITGQQRRLETQAVTDPLTGVSNRMLLHSVLEQAVLQNHRTGVPMTLLALDLDYFKTINDTLGHDAGDTVLRGVGELLRTRLRRSDNVFRVGGEEFIILLHGTDADSARRVAEELRTSVLSRPLLPDRIISASIGVATLRPDEDWTEWMKRADENLYRAKSSGRNRVEA